MPATVTIQNEQRLLRKLTRMPQVVRDQIRLAMAEQADEIVAMARRLAPPHIVSSIAWKWGGRVPKGMSALGQVRSSGLTLTIYANHWTARWFEFGTAERFHANGKSVGAISRQPFFFPAYRAQRRQAKAAFRLAARKAAQKVASEG